MNNQTPLQICLDLLDKSTAEAVTTIFVQAQKQTNAPKLMLLRHTCLHLIDSKWEVTFNILKETSTPVSNIDKLFQVNRTYRLLMEHEFDTLIERVIALENMNDLEI